MRVRSELLPNYDDGKTEALLLFAGGGSTASRKSFFKTGEGRVDFFTTAGDRIRMRCVHSYKHLGSTITDNCSALPDLKRKTGMAKAWQAHLPRQCSATRMCHFGVAV